MYWGLRCMLTCCTTGCSTTESKSPTICMDTVKTEPFYHILFIRWSTNFALHQNMPLWYLKIECNILPEIYSWAFKLFCMVYLVLRNGTPNKITRILDTLWVYFPINIKQKFLKFIYAKLRYDFFFEWDVVYKFAQGGLFINDKHPTCFMSWESASWTHWIRDWWAPQWFWMCWQRENPCPCQIWTPRCPACSQSLYSIQEPFLYKNKIGWYIV